MWEPMPSKVGADLNVKDTTMGPQKKELSKGDGEDG